MIFSEENATACCHCHNAILSVQGFAKAFSIILACCYTVARAEVTKLVLGRQVSCKISSNPHQTRLNHLTKVFRGILEACMQVC